MKAVKLETEGISQFIFPNGEPASFFFFLLSLAEEGCIVPRFYSNPFLQQQKQLCNKIMSKDTMDVGFDMASALPVSPF